jgi:hypothetical protein
MRYAPDGRPGVVLPPQIHIRVRKGHLEEQASAYAAGLRVLGTIQHASVTAIPASSSAGPNISHPGNSCVQTYHTPATPVSKHITPRQLLCPNISHPGNSCVQRYHAPATPVSKDTTPRQLQCPKIPRPGNSSVNNQPHQIRDRSYIAP